MEIDLDPFPNSRLDHFFRAPSSTINIFSQSEKNKNFNNFFLIFFGYAPFGYLYFHYFSIVIASIAYNDPVYGAWI